MNRGTAIVAMLAGIALLVGSCVPAGLIVYRAFNTQEVFTQTLTSGQGFSSPAIELSREGLARVVVHLDVDSPSVQEERTAGTTEYKARYHFPFTYRVRDEAGHTLVNESVNLAWNEGTRTSVTEKSVSTSGSATVRHELKKFPVPASGSVFVEARIDPDERYRARAVEVKLQVQDRLVSETPSLVASFLLWIAGALLVVVGGAFAISAVASSANTSALARGADSEKARKLAALCHLSGFLGYLLPFGGALGVMAVWLGLREAEPYVDAQGKEALNFQVSVLIYGLASVLLMLILVGFLLFLALMIYHFAFMIVAAVAAAQGRDFRYPLILRLVK